MSLSRFSAVALAAVFSMSAAGCAALDADENALTAPHVRTNSDGVTALDEAPAIPTEALAHPADSVSPLVLGMPLLARLSIESVGQYIKEREPDPYLRVKALHDYVATRIDFDRTPFTTNARLKDRDADLDPVRVFKRGRAGSLGYAVLLAALAKATGDDVEAVEGIALLPDGTPLGHAWNIAQIGEQRRSIDVMWDAGWIDATSQAHYSTRYFMPPPDTFAADHHAFGLDVPIMRTIPPRQPMLPPPLQLWLTRDGGLRDYPS